MASLLTTSGIPAAVSLGSLTIDSIDVPEAFIGTLTCTTIGGDEIVANTSVTAPAIVATTIEAETLTVEDAIVSVSVSAPVINTDSIIGLTTGTPLSIASYDTNQNINLSPDGTGAVVVKAGNTLSASIINSNAVANTLQLQTNGTTRLLIPSGGFTSFNGTNLAVYDTFTKELGYRTIQSMFIENTTNMAITGFTAGVNCSITYTVLGNLMVYLRLRAFTGTKSGNGPLTFTLPSIPLSVAANALFPVFTTDGGSLQLGQMLIAPGALCTLYKTTAGGDFTDTAVCGINGDAYVSYYITSSP